MMYFPFTTAKPTDLHLLRLHAVEHLNLYNIYLSLHLLSTDVAMPWANMHLPPRKARFAAFVLHGNIVLCSVGWCTLDAD